MGKENLINIAGAAARLYTENRYFWGAKWNHYFHFPETVGRTGVREVVVQDSGLYPGFSEVMLDLNVSGGGDISQKIVRVPKGWFEVGSTADIIVSKGKNYNHVDEITQIPKVWFVTIRPYDRSTHVKPIQEDDKELRKMLSANKMRKNTHRDFYNTFIADRSHPLSFR